MDLHLAVQSGARLLDLQEPDWFKRVDIDRLQMSSCLDDILGQLTGFYRDGLNRYAPADATWAAYLQQRDWAAMNGFTLYDCNGEEDPALWQNLTRIWQQAIRDRLKPID